MSKLTPTARPRTNGWLELFRSEMDDMFDRFFGGPLIEQAEQGQTWSPRVDVEETGDELLVKADVPGVDPKDLDITVREGALLIRGDKKEEREEKDKNFHRTERFQGRFFRSIPLPAGTDTDKISAEVSNGVVVVRIPKSPEMQPKKISVAAKD